MAKILYIEDELTKNISSIKKFFTNTFKDKNFIKNLNELENRDGPIYPDDVLTACNYCKALEICYSFPMALQCIINNPHIYDLIIIDRNLSEIDYLDDLNYILELLNDNKYGLNMNYNEDQLLSFYSREGDLLLMILLRQDPSLSKLIYFLTANTKDALRDSDTLKTIIDLKSFMENQIIEKGSEDENKIIDILKNLKNFRIQNKYYDQCQALRNQSKEDLVNQFIQVVCHYEQKDNEVFCLKIRKILESMLYDIALKINNPKISSNKEDFWDDHNNLKISLFLTQENGLSKYENQIQYNNIIRNFCISLYKICSQYGAHSSKEHNLNIISKYVTSALLNQLCEVIIWYDKALNILNNEKNDSVE